MAGVTADKRDRIPTFKVARVNRAGGWVTKIEFCKSRKGKENQGKRELLFIDCSRKAPGVMIGCEQRRERRAERALEMAGRPVKGGVRT